MPLHPTGKNGEFVVGIRYRAWQPPSALHPTIPPHAPLVFDLFDRWNDRSIAGCTYHVAHAGGRAFDRLPRNAAEAESRRASRCLGLTLVQTQDLTVRNARLCLKTLGGLQQVDVVLRRLQDDACDPLEVRTDRPMGVPGFLEAVRAGNVAVVNPVGSAVLQSPAFIPYLPAICRELLGEELACESIPTYWCGDSSCLAYVDQHLADLIVRPAFGGGQAPVFGRDLSPRALEELRARIHAQPRAFAAQEPLVLSTVPAIVDDHGVGAGHLWMRAYLVASSDGYAVMPGCLSRVGNPGEHLSLALRPGGRSKDTWVLSSGPPGALTLLPPPDAPAILSRGGGDLQSRVADDLFWLGRYAERADGTARTARAVAARLADQGTTSDAELPADLDALLWVLVGPSVRATIPPAASSEPPRATGHGRPAWVLAAEQAVLASVLESDSVESLKAIIESAHRIARMLRDRVSLDTWRTLVRLERDLRETRSVTGPSRVRALVAVLNDVITTLAAFSGLAMDSMTRGQAWRFLDMGRRLERAAHTTAPLRGTLSSTRPREGAVLEAILEVADSSMTYRRRYLASLQAAPVVDLLLMDETNPRSVMFQIAALNAHIDALPREAGVLRSSEQKLMLAISAQLALADVIEICRPDPQGERAALVECLDCVAAALRDLSTSLSAVYLNHAVVSRQTPALPWLRGHCTSYSRESSSRPRSCAKIWGTKCWGTSKLSTQSRRSRPRDVRSQRLGVVRAPPPASQQARAGPCGQGGTPELARPS